MLRPYQARAVEQTVPRLWEAGKSSVVLVAPTGSGKTVMGCALVQRIIAKRHGQVWWLAHAQELIDQPADDLRGMGLDYAFVKSGRSANAASLVQLAQVQSMITRAVVPAASCSRAFVVIDECFPAGTDVSGRPIEQYRVGDYVEAFDSAGVIRQRRVIHVFSSVAAALVRVCFTSGLELICTPNHPILSDGGFVAAGNLQPGSTVYARDVESYLRRVRRHFHCSEACRPLPRVRCTQKQAYPSRNDVLSVPGEICPDAEGANAIHHQPAPVLRQDVQLCVSCANLQRAYDEDQPARSRSDFCAYASEQPHGRRGDAEPHGADAPRDRPQADPPRRQRHGDDGAAGQAVSGSATGQPPVGRRVHTCGGSRKEYRLPTCVQVGLGASVAEIGDRSRWIQPHSDRASAPGPQENRVVAVDRVDRVEVYECRGDGEPQRVPGGYRVYNLEVDTDHTYFANDVAVHNCHHMRCSTHTLLRMRLLEAYQYVYFLLLTATPYRHDGQGLRDMAHALVEATTPRQLIAIGAIADPIYYSEPDEEEAPAEQAPQRAKLVGDVVQTWLARSGGAPSIYRAVNRAHSRALVERFRKAGARAEHLDGDTPDPVRVRMLGRLSVGGQDSDHPEALDVVVTGGTILEEGFDSKKSYLAGALADPSLWVRGEPPAYSPLVVLGCAARTRSRGAWIQRLGRVTRVHNADAVYAMARAPWRLPDGRSGTGLPSRVKRRALTLCHSGNLERHGFLVEHENFDLYGDATGAGGAKAGGHRAAPVTCRACLAVSPSGTPLCAGCGAALARGSMDIPREDASVQLVERAPTERAKLPPDPAAMERHLRQFYAELRARSAQRVARGEPPYRPGWAAQKFKALYGDWPPQHLDRALRQELGIH